MSDAFRSSDEFDEEAHQLYNQGRYDDAIRTLKDGLSLYPTAVELHVGMGYAHLAREDYAWARQRFAQAVALEPDHEDALAGLGEAQLRIGHIEAAVATFDRVLELGFQDDHDLMLQIGRALFREGLVAQAHRYFDLAANTEPECEDAAACMGYASHRAGREAAAMFWLRRALELEPGFAEPRIYLANMLYDRGESAAALHHFERTEPGDHYEELGLYRIIELKKTFYRLADDDATLEPWLARLSDIVGPSDPLDDLLLEIEALQSDGSVRDPTQLELFGTLQSEPQQMQRRPGHRPDHHQVATLTGHVFRGTWDEILAQLKAADQGSSAQTMVEFMAGLARQGREETGVVIPVGDAEAFIRGNAEAGGLRIIQ
jgi:Tfp pilus assembly protein PilF